MLSSTDFDRLRSEAEARRQRLLDSIDSARREVKDVEKYLARLEITERHIAVNGAGDTTATRQKYIPRFLKDKLGLPEMIGHVLQVDVMKSSAGKSLGLKPSEIRLEIKREFDEDVKVRAINSHVWYLFSKGRVMKNGRSYFLPSESPIESADQTKDDSSAHSDTFHDAIFGEEKQAGL